MNLVSKLMTWITLESCEYSKLTKTKLHINDDLHLKN